MQPKQRGLLGLCLPACLPACLAPPPPPPRCPWSGGKTGPVSVCLSVFAPQLTVALSVQHDKHGHVSVSSTRLLLVCCRICIPPLPRVRRLQGDDKKHAERRKKRGSLERSSIHPFVNSCRRTGSGYQYCGGRHRRRPRRRARGRSCRQRQVFTPIRYISRPVNSDEL